MAAAVLHTLLRPRRASRLLKRRLTASAGSYPEVDVWIDIKSPHAYLAVRPSLQLAEDYHCQVHFRPYNLSYVSIGVTTHHDKSDPTRRPADANADRKARGYYSTARKYAAAQGLRIRGPRVLLDAHLANIGLLYAGRDGRAAEYALAVYDAGWPNG